MNMTKFKLLGMLGAVMASWSCSSSSGVALKDSSSNETVVRSRSSSQEASFAKALHREVNNYRVSQGLTPLNYHQGLERVARGHSRFMKQRAVESTGGKLTTHYGIDSRRLLVKKKYGMEAMSENVIVSYELGQGENLAKTMVKNWIGSKVHRMNITDKWANTGVSVEFDDQGRVFVTQVFGSAKSKVAPVGGPLNQW